MNKKFQQVNRKQLKNQFLLLFHYSHLLSCPLDATTIKDGLVSQV